MSYHDDDDRERAYQDECRALRIRFQVEAEAARDAAFLEALARARDSLYQVPEGDYFAKVAPTPLRVVEVPYHVRKARERR